jgi:hypothetical protein
MVSGAPIGLEGSEGIKVSLEIKGQAEDAPSEVGMPPRMAPES